MSLFIDGKQLISDKDLGKLLNITKTAKTLGNQDDLNYLEPGLYGIDTANGAPKNYPYNNGTNSILINFKRNDAGALVQLLIGNDGLIWLHTGAGNPFNFIDWKLLNPVTDSEMKNLIQRITNLENKLGGVNSPLYFTHLQELEVA